MNNSEKISFNYKPKLGTFPALVVATLFLVASIGIASCGFLTNYPASLSGIRISATITKLLFLSFSTLLAYVAIKTFVVTARSADSDRYIHVSADQLTSPVSPESRNTVTIKFSDIASIKTISSGNASFLEIVHKKGKLRIPNVMIESAGTFDYLISLINERITENRQRLKPVNQTSVTSQPHQPMAEKTDCTPLGPAGDALLRAIEEKRQTDPLIGAKLGGKEIVQRLITGMKAERGVHIESLLCALGSLAGYSCQASLRAQALLKGLDETAALITTCDENGKKYFFGDSLNQSLAESKYSVWSLAAGAAEHNGCAVLPDIRGIFEHVTNTVGTDSFGVPRFPLGHSSGELPINYLKTLWPRLLPLLKLYCKRPIEWPILFGFAIQEALDAGKIAISPDVALQIIMEAAVPMSKVDLAAA